MTELHVVPDPEPKPKRPYYGGGAPKGPKCPQDAGPMLKATWLEINEMELSGREYTRWREIAVAAARTADNSIAEGKPAHFTPAVKVLTEAMDRLHALTRKQKEGDGDPLGGMGTFGATGT